MNNRQRILQLLDIIKKAEERGVALDEEVLPELDSRVRRFFGGFQKFVTQGKSMRTNQTNYFNARKVDQYDAKKLLKMSQDSEKEFDATIKSLESDLDETPTAPKLFS